MMEQQVWMEGTNWTDCSNEETHERQDGSRLMARLLLQRNWTLDMYTGYKLDVWTGFYFDVGVTRGCHRELH